MAIGEPFSGTATISTTEWSLPRNAAYDIAQPQTSDGVYQVFIDFANLVAGDTYEVRLYERVIAGGTQRLLENWFVDGQQAKPGWWLPSVMLLHGWDVTLDRIAGADRSISWSIRAVT